MLTVFTFAEPSPQHSVVHSSKFFVFNISQTHLHVSSVFPGNFQPHYPHRKLLELFRKGGRNHGQKIDTC